MTEEDLQILDDIRERSRQQKAAGTPRVQTGAGAPPRVLTSTGAASGNTLPPVPAEVKQEVRQVKAPAEVKQEVHQVKAPPTEAPVLARTRANTAPIALRTQSQTTANLTQALAASYDLTNGRMSAARLLGRKFPKHFFDVANAVLDADTGQTLTYRRLIQHPKFKEEWSHLSANEFRRLFQGVGGRIKDPTNRCFSLT